MLRVIRCECRTLLSVNCGCWHAPANERLRHAHPGAGMLTVAAPSGTGGTRAAVTDGGGGAGMQCASSRLWPAGWRVPPAALERTGLADMRAAAERAVRGLF